MGELASRQCIFCARTAFECQRGFLESAVIKGLGMCGDCLEILSNEYLEVVDKE